MKTIRIKNQTRHNWQKRLLLVAGAAIAFILGPPFEMAAQTNIQVGPLYNCPTSSMYNFKVLDCPSEKYCNVFYTNSSPEGGFKAEISKSWITDAFKLGGCTIDGKALDSVKNDVPRDVNPTNTRPTSQTGRFKVGDRVLASRASMAADEYYEKCTVIKDYMITEGADAYRVLCDDAKGGIGAEGNVGPKYIRAWANATPPPATPPCPFNEPPGTVTRASRPSAELFQRVMYEWKVATSNGRKVGMTFQTFQMHAAFRNVVMSVPGVGAQLKHDGAPQGATIYPLKTRYLFCDKYTDSTIRWLVESQFACFKDKFGDWVCPVDSVPKFLEQIYLPNK